jgi:hypothetical protein
MNIESKYNQVEKCVHEMILKEDLIPVIVCLDEAALKHHLSTDLAELQATWLPKMRAQNQSSVGRGVTEKTICSKVVHL